MIPNLGFQKDDCKRVLVAQAKEKRELLNMLEDLNRHIDIFINDFLQVWGLGSAGLGNLHQSFEMHVSFSSHYQLIYM